MEFKSKLGFAVLAVLVVAIGFLWWNFVHEQSKSESGNVADASALQIHDQCESKAGNELILECYTQTFHDYIAATDARQALGLLVSLGNLGGYAQTNCHPLAHKIGNLALDYYGSVLKASQYYMPLCYFGYYHGVVEEYIAKEPNLDTAVITACGTYDPANASETQCLVGLGHGIMEYEQDDVLKSLQDCDLLAVSARTVCYSGVFADDVTGDLEAGQSANENDDYISACNKLPENYKQQCLNAKTS